jgi:GntR family transcriptional regulator, transcriptional repressor for pyruvate dehydrogenase complex
VNRFSPVRSDASEQIAQRIRAYLSEAGLQPGDRIGTEHELAREFGVSRPTLREGLRLLSAAHLIRVSRGRAGGVFVANTANEGMRRSLTESIASMLAADSVSLHELLEARMFLEIPLAGLAAANATDQVAADLDRAISAASGHPPGSEEFSAADTRFHRVLAEAAGNELLIAFTSWTLDVLQPSLVEQIGARVDGPSIIAQHRAIQRAVSRHQSEAAQRAMSRHLQYLYDQVSSLAGR